MALTTYEEIKQQLLDEWEYVNDDTVHQYAEELIPIYYSGIQEEWLSLPGDEIDVWHDYVGELNSSTSIFKLMSYDLLHYYFQLVDKAFNDIKEAQEDA